jgi:hypothetical protein
MRPRALGVGAGKACLRGNRRAVIVEPPTQALVELLRSFDGGHGDEVERLPKGAGSLEEPTVDQRMKRSYFPLMNIDGKLALRIMSAAHE